MYFFLNSGFSIIHYKNNDFNIKNVIKYFYMVQSYKMTQNNRSLYSLILIYSEHSSSHQDS